MAEVTEEDLKDANKRIRDLTKIRVQADKYMTVVHGRGYCYRAPEMYSNLIERWIYCIAGGRIDAAEVVMFDIEGMVKESKHA
jgi:hypothetical protein